ncbi:hypothetical protein MPSEU_000158500 [Mayamaea pseudoterrestris]|nr:hypothetical protein MPSEU_000158500 [Mayamaea pseudoterrestris]
MSHLFRSLLPSVTKSHSERRILRTNPHHLFNIINDVDKYHTFLPLCTRSKIIWRSSNEYRATLTVGLPPLLEETYTSHVVSNATRLIVTAKSIQSHRFKALSSEWKLRATDNEDECLVDFNVSLTVSDPFIVATLDQILQQVAGKQVDAFEKQCQRVPFASTMGTVAQLGPKQ